MFRSSDSNDHSCADLWVTFTWNYTVLHSASGENCVGGNLILFRLLHITVHDRPTCDRVCSDATATSISILSSFNNMNKLTVHCSLTVTSPLHSTKEVNAAMAPNDSLPVNMIWQLQELQVPQLFVKFTQSSSSASISDARRKWGCFFFFRWFWE